MKLFYLSAAISFMTLNVIAQEPTGSIQPVKVGENVSVKFGGFARADYFFDTRKGKEGVDGLLYLWPEPAKFDANGNDLNSKLNHNLSATATRFTALFAGPETFKAKTSAYLEYDFTAGNSGFVNFRQGWLKLDWTKSSLMIGRNWHPLLGPVLPSTISLNFGTPFGIFCRGEQVRFTYKAGTMSFVAATFWQAGHASFGPNAANNGQEQSLRFLRNSMVPDLNLQIHFSKGNVLTGLMGEFKSLQPLEFTTVGNINYKTSEKVNSFAIGAFGQIKAGKFTAKVNSLYGQNLAEMMMQGGYAMVYADALTGHEEYTPSAAFTSWVNLTYGETVRWGIFAGIQKNLGFMDDLQPAYFKFYGRSQDVASMWRVAPSVSITSGRTAFQVEWELTGANYGTVDFADKGKVKDVKGYVNSRLGLSVSFYF